jgi:hypothetical protein
VLGLGVLLAVGLSMVTARLRPTPGTLVSAGFASGFMGWRASIGGPPMALVYQRAVTDRPSAPPSPSTSAAGAGHVAHRAGLRRPGRYARAAARAPPPGRRRRRLPALQATTRYLDDGRTRALVLAISAAAAALLIAEEVL